MVTKAIYSINIMQQQELRHPVLFSDEIFSLQFTITNSSFQTFFLCCTADLLKKIKSLLQFLKVFLMTNRLAQPRFFYNLLLRNYERLKPRCPNRNCKKISSNNMRLLTLPFLSSLSNKCTFFLECAK
jgi:hypothetical protein